MFRGSVSTTRRHEEAARESNTSNFNDGNGSVDGRWCGSPGCLGSKVRDYNIPGMPFRVHQFGTPVPSLRSSQPHEDLLLLLLRPSSPRPLPPRRSRIRRVRATRRSRAILSRKDLLSAGIGKLHFPRSLFTARSLPFFIPRVLLRVSFRFFVKLPPSWTMEERRNFCSISNLYNLLFFAFVQIVIYFYL